MDSPEEVHVRMDTEAVSMQEEGVEVDDCGGGVEASKNLKRQREPLSSEEENIQGPQAPPRGLKRRCLTPSGGENVNPLLQRVGSPANSHLWGTERALNPDTPTTSSIQSRQEGRANPTGGARISGAAPPALRCLSDPGLHSNGPCVEEEGPKADLHLIGNTEFRSRAERFQLQPPRDSPSLSTPRPRILSSFVRNIQRKLRSAETPSTCRAEQIRQEREQELRQLRSQSISENAWLKRSFSDSFLAEVTPTQSFTKVSRLSKRLTWPPLHPWDQFAAGVQGKEAGNPEERPVLNNHASISIAIPSEEIQCFSPEANPQMKNSGELEEFPEGEKSRLLTEESSGQHHEEPGSSVSGHQEEPVPPTDRHQEEAGSTISGQQEEAGSTASGQQEEAGSTASGQQEEAGSTVSGHREEAGSSTSGQQEEDGSSTSGFQEAAASPASGRQDDAPSGSKLQKETDVLSGGSLEDSLSCKDENAGPSCAPQEEVASPSDTQGEMELPSDEPEVEMAQDHSLEKIACERHGPVLHNLKKATFDRVPEMSSGLGSETDGMKPSAQEAELGSHEEMNTSEMIDRMFEGVLDITVEEDEREDEGAGDCCDPQLGKEGTKEGEKVKEEEESEPLDTSLDEMLTIPPSCVLSPLSSSMEVVVTSLRLASKCLLDPPPLLLTPEEPTPSPVINTSPPYSIDTYRTQQQVSQQAVQSTTPVVCGCSPERARLVPSVNTKEKIAVSMPAQIFDQFYLLENRPNRLIQGLCEEAARLQGIITQTLQALNCCTDQGHGKGSLEEAEAEKLLLVSCEKRAALLAEVSRLREGAMGDLGLDSGFSSPEPCRGTVTIRNLQLPLKVEFLCSSHTRTGETTHYFFVLVRYGACNIVATPLATAADAQNGDTVSFPTSITLQDIRSSFQIDVEVYSMSPTPGNNFNMEQRSTKRKVTPKRLLNSITRLHHSITSATMPSVSSRHSTSFSLVGSHKITLSSLGQTKFPLDKVPFLCPLEGNIYLQLQCEGHSHVQHRGFLTMFEDVCGFGAWHRRWFCLQGSSLSYWSYPSYEQSKPAEGVISLPSSSIRSVQPVKKGVCARPHTFELVSSGSLQQDHFQPINKCWFSADTREDRAQWLEKLNQALLDLHTWSPHPTAPAPRPSGPTRESML